MIFIIHRDDAVKLMPFVDIDPSVVVDPGVCFAASPEVQVDDPALVDTIRDLLHEHCVRIVGQFGDYNESLQ